MPTSYLSMLDLVESDLYDDSPVPAKTMAKVLATIAEQQLARVEESLDLVRDQPSSVQNVFEYGLGHPGGISAKQIETAVGVSSATLKRAHKVLQERGLARYETEYSRSGRTALWHYSTGLFSRAFVDLGSVSRSDHGSVSPAQEVPDPMTPSHDSSITPTTCGNGQESGQGGVAPVTGGVSQSLCLELSGQVVSSSGRPTPPVVARERRRQSRALHAAAWTTREMDAAPVLARYRELIESRGFLVYDDHALPIWHQLTRLVEDHGLATAQEFLDHVERACERPYRANAMATFEARWWSLDRAEARAQSPQPTTPANDPEVVRERVSANNERLRQKALGMRSAS